MNLVALVAALALAPAAAHGEPAADPGPPASVSSSPASTEPSDCGFQLLLYGWASAIDATVSARGVTSEPSASFIDLLKDLRWAVEGAGEVRYKRALLILDLIGNQLKVNSDSNALTVPGWRLLSLPVSDLLGSESPEDPRKLDVDVFTGIRYWNVKNSVRAKITPGSPTIDGMTIDLGGLEIPPIDFGDITLPGEWLSGGAGTSRNAFSGWIGSSLRGFART